jgi:predicted DNA-binding transcriptional regulator AlpA
MSLPAATVFDDDDALVGTARVRQILNNCSDMHIWRLLNDERYADLQFPQPIKINRFKYWKLGWIRQFTKRQEQRSAAARNSTSTQ